MAKSEAPVEDKDRAERWAAILVALEKQNPAAFAARKESGEFESIPASFE